MPAWSTLGEDLAIYLSAHGLTLRSAGTAMKVFITSSIADWKTVKGIEALKLAAPNTFVGV